MQINRFCIGLLKTSLLTVLNLCKFTLNYSFPLENQAFPRVVGILPWQTYSLEEEIKKVY